MRRARGTARPTGQRPDVDPQPPRPSTGPAAARGPRRRRPVTAGGAPPRAGRPPAPEGPADARRPPPRRPPPRRGAEPAPAPPTLTHPVRPAPPDPVLSPQPIRWGDPYPNPRFRAPSPPPHTTTEGGGKGLRRGAGRQAGRGHASEVRERREQGGRTGQTAAGGVGGGGRGGRKPRGSEGVGRRGAWRPARQAQSGRRTAGRRPAEADRPRAGDGRRRGKASGPATGSRRPPRRTARQTRPEDPRRADPRPLWGEAVVAGATGRKARGVGWGRGELAEPTPSPPHPRTLGANLEGRGGEGRAIGKRGRTPEGDATGRRGRVAGRPRPGGGGTEARRGRRREEGRGRASRRRRTRLFPPDIPTTLPRRPPTSLARLLAPQTHRGVAPDRPPAARGGRGALRTRLALPLSPPPGPIPRRTGGGEAREPGAGRGEAPAPLSEPTALMILPQVHLRKPCYDFYFL